MLNRDDLQQAITFASKGGLGPSVSHCAFELTNDGWIPRTGCLTEGYSSGEKVLCSVLLCFYFEMFGKPSHVEVPSHRDYNNSATDLIWPGAWYFVSATCRLSEESSWHAIKMLLPRSN